MTRNRYRAYLHVAGCVLIGVLCLGLFGASTARAQDLVPELDVVEATSQGNEITVTVVAPRGLRSTVITSDSFVVNMNGESIVPIVEPIAGDEHDVVLLVDVSGSMTEEALTAARASGTAFVNQLPAQAQVAVVSFGDEAVLVQPFTTDGDEVVAALNELEGAGETALHAAVVEAARLFDPTRDSIRTIVLLSDGGNTVDESSLGSAQAAIIASEATLYAISIQTDEANEAELASLAAASGGTIARAEEVQEIEALYSDIAVDLGNQYRLRFTASGEGSQSARIVAEGVNGVLAETTLTIDLAQSAPEATTLAPESIVPPPSAPEPRAPEASAPNVTTVEVADQTALKWASIAAVAAAAVIIGMVLLTPGTSRQRRVKPAERFERQAMPQDRGSPVRWVVNQMTGGVERLLGGHRLGPWVSGLLDTAGWKVRNSEFILLVALMSIVAFMVGAARSFAVGIALVVVVIGLVSMVLMLMVKRRRRAFGQQLNSTLQMMAGALRTGYSLPQVVSLVAEEAEAPTREEFSRMAVEIRLGRGLVEAAVGVGERMGSADFLWTTGAIDIARDVGGDLAEVLDNVSATVRTRDQVRRQIQALSAEGRISAWILIALPFPIFFWQMLVNREYTMLLMTDSMGRIIFGSGLTLLVVGTFWLRRQIRIEY